MGVDVLDRELDEIRRMLDRARLDQNEMTASDARWNEINARMNLIRRQLKRRGLDSGRSRISTTLAPAIRRIVARRLGLFSEDR